MDSYWEIPEPGCLEGLADLREIRKTQKVMTIIAEVKVRLGSQVGGGWVGTAVITTATSTAATTMQKMSTTCGLYVFRGAENTARQSSEQKKYNYKCEDALEK